MSFLTKMFVVLLVLCALLQSAALVVYVEKTEDFKKSTDTALINTKQANQARDAATTELERVRASAAVQNSTMLSNVQALQVVVHERQATIAELQNQLAAAAVDNQTARADLVKVTEALNKSISQVGGQATELAAIRLANDGLNKRNQELSDALTDVTAARDQALNVVKYMTEQLADAQAQIQQLQKGGVLNGNAAATPSSPISGVVTDAKMIAGMPYATISVGSADNVQPTMRFNVVRGADFIGFLTVDTVQAHEAVGRLQGPKVPAPKDLPTLTGAEAKTQL